MLDVLQLLRYIRSVILPVQGATTRYHHCGALFTHQLLDGICCINMSWSMQQLWHRCSIRIANCSFLSKSDCVADEGALCTNIVTNSISDTESDDLTNHITDSGSHDGTICVSYNYTYKCTHNNTDTRTNGVPNSDTDTVTYSGTNERTQCNTHTCTNSVPNSFSDTFSHSYTIKYTHSNPNSTDCHTFGNTYTFTNHIVTHNIANDITHRVPNANHSNSATHCFSDTDTACAAVRQLWHD